MSEIRSIILVPEEGDKFGLLRPALIFDGAFIGLPPMARKIDGKWRPVPGWAADNALILAYDGEVVALGCFILSELDDWYSIDTLIRCIRTLLDPPNDYEGNPANYDWPEGCRIVCIDADGAARLNLTETT